MDSRVDLSDLPAKGTLKRHWQSLYDQHVPAELARRSGDLGPDKPGAHQHHPRRATERVANRLAVAQRAQREHVSRLRNIRQTSRRATEAEDEHVERNLVATGQLQLALAQRASGHALAQPQFNPFFRVISIVMEEDLR